MDLAAYYEVDISQTDARFSFTQSEQTTQWLIANLDGSHIDVARCPVETDDFMVPDIDVVLAMTPTDWQTVKVLHTGAVWAAFVKTVIEQGQPLSDPGICRPV